MRLLLLDSAGVIKEPAAAMTLAREPLLHLIDDFVITLSRHKPAAHAMIALSDAPAQHVFALPSTHHHN
jgi:hypothetical protein